MGFFDKLKKIVINDKNNQDIGQKQDKTKQIIKDEKKPLKENLKNKETKKQTEEKILDEKEIKANLGFNLKSLINKFKEVDQNFLDDLEETLLKADLGYEFTRKIIKNIKEFSNKNNIKTKEDLKENLTNIIYNIFGDNNSNLLNDDPKILFISGVNGAGKTTSIGKIANDFKKQGKKVILIPADTFRAGAIKQLENWANKAGVLFSNANDNEDPASAVYKGLKKAKDNDCDVIIIDTSGRLQNKTNLMKEIEKIYKVVEKFYANKKINSLITIDANTGQNGLNQAKEFLSFTKLNGVILTKMDGSAKGGIIFAIKKDLNLDIKYMMSGEQINDLEVFDKEKFLTKMLKDII